MLHGAVTHPGGAAAESHSSAVGRRSRAQKAKFDASYHEMPTTGESSPGDTRFIVRLPLTERRAP